MTKPITAGATVGQVIDAIKETYAGDCPVAKEAIAGWVSTRQARL